MKLKAYLPSRRPLATPDLAALDGWRDVVRVANTPETFAAAVMAALTGGPIDVSGRLAAETWDAKAGEILSVMAETAGALAPHRTTTAAAA